MFLVLAFKKCQSYTIMWHLKYLATNQPSTYTKLLFSYFLYFSSVCKKFFFFSPHFDLPSRFYLFPGFSAVCICVCACMFGIYPDRCFWISWICCLVSLTNFGKILVIISSNISVLFFPFWYLSHAYVTQFDIVSQFLDVLFCFLILYSLGISV